MIPQLMVYLKIKLNVYVNMSRILTIINHVYENLVEKLEKQETYFIVISKKVCELTFLDIWV